MNRHFPMHPQNSGERKHPIEPVIGYGKFMDKTLTVPCARSHRKGERLAFGKCRNRFLPAVLCAIGANLCMYALENTRASEVLVLGWLLIVGSGVSVVNGAFRDTGDESVSNVQHSLPVSAKTRYFDKLLVILRYHIVPVIAWNALFLLLLPGLGFSLTDTLRPSVVKDGFLSAFLVVFTLAVLTDAATVLILACIGDRRGSFFGGCVLIGIPMIVIGFKIYSSTALTEALRPYPPILLLYYVVVTCAVAGGMLFLAGKTYTGRDARSVRIGAAGELAAEVMIGGVAFLLAWIVLGNRMAWVNLGVIFVFYLLLCLLLLRGQRSGKFVVRRLVSFAIVTVLAVLVTAQTYFADAYEFQHLKKEVSRYAADTEGDREEYQCEVNTAHAGWGILGYLYRDAYSVSFQNDNRLSREQVDKVVETLETFCENRSVPDFYSYAFHGERCKPLNGLSFELVVMVPDRYGNLLQSVRYIGYLAERETKEDLYEVLRQAGFTEYTTETGEVVK